VRLQEFVAGDKISGGAYSTSVIHARRTSLRAERLAMGIDALLDGAVGTIDENYAITGY
jgi:hypothetical protein